jgi:hypothetical protein
MNPESIVTSLEMSKKLKEAGFPQDIPEEYGDEQSRWWCQYDDDEPTLLWCQTDEFNDDGTHGEDHECELLYKAPFAEEILRSLGTCMIRFGHKQEGLITFEVQTPAHMFVSNETSLADALAEFYCYASRNNLLPPSA